MTSPLIAHVLPFPCIAGTEVATLRLAQAAREGGFQSIAFCLSDAVRDLFAAEDFRTARYEAIEPSYRHPKQYWHDSLKLARRFREERVCLIHCADVLAGHYASLAALLSRKKLVCHVRNRIDTITLRNRGFLMPVDKYIFVSRNTWKSFAFTVPAAQGVVLYDGIEPRPEIDGHRRRALAERFRREFNIPAPRKIIGMVGRISAQKDYATLARAALQVVQEHDVCFALVGDYSAPLHREVYEETRRLLSTLGISDKFIFTGFRRDVPEIMAAFDIFVLSTHFEGFPLVILEAMADARPVAATAVDGISEIVQHEVTGLLHAQEDHAQLSANLMRLLDDPPMAARLAATAKDLVAREFNRAIYAGKVSELYRSLIPARRCRL